MSRTARQQLGQWGEDWACSLLQEAGYELLARNYRVPGRGELDLVLRRAGAVYAFEIKLRRSGQEASEQLLSPRQQHNIKLCLERFLQERNWMDAPRYYYLLGLFYGPSGDLLDYDLEAF